MLNKNITITEIDEKEALRYIGANGTDDSKVLSIMEESKKKLIQVINPKYVYKCFDFENTQNGVHIIGCDFELVEDIL